MHRYAVTVIHSWITLDCGEINYPGETSVLETFLDLDNAIAAATQAKADGKEAVVIDQAHPHGPRRISRP